MPRPRWNEGGAALGEVGGGSQGPPKRQEIRALGQTDPQCREPIEPTKNAGARLQPDVIEPSFARAPPAPSPLSSIELAFPAGQVGQLMGGFGSLPDWLPYIPRMNGRSGLVGCRTQHQLRGCFW